ncbi:hypothetical protein F5879DRAFT_414621 [Lentinula edodes]|nr:hypothetical protein F5879DRAFT_414621 [Lentinula edodes]
MYFYRLISALAFVSMVLAAAVPSPGSPIADAHQPLALPSNGPQLSSENEKTIEVTFSQDSADPKWIQNTQDNVQSGVMEVLRRAWPKYSLQSVKIKDVKFHGFVSGATNHHTFKVKFLEALPTLAGFGECEGWVTVGFGNRGGTHVAVVSGEINSKAGDTISSIKSYRYGIARS